MRRSSNIVPANVEAIRKRVKEAANQSQEQIDWRVADRPGLVLITRKSSGAASWYYFFTPNHAKKQSKMLLGKFPDVSLADATQALSELRVRVAKGENPAAHKKAVKASLTFRELTEEFVASGAISARTALTYAWALKADAFPAFGDKPAVAVTSDDIAGVCRTIQDRGALVQARNTKAAIGGVFACGRRKNYVKTNPARDVNVTLDVPSQRSRTPSNDELAQLWRAIDGAENNSFGVRAILKLCILTGQRRSEVAGARCDELRTLATDTPVWIIAASTTKAGRVVTEGRMKNKTEQRVYLSRQAAAIFQAAMHECSDGEYLFPTLSPTSKGTTRTPYINGESVTRAMTRLRQTHGIRDVTIHDMRRAIGNFLKDAGIGREVRDMVLHHKDDSVDGRHYSQGARMESQCREAWQLWADHVEKVVSAPQGVRELPVG